MTLLEPPGPAPVSRGCRPGAPAVVLFVACAALAVDRAGAQPPSAPLPVPTPALDNLDPLVQEQIRERRDWQRRVLDAAVSSIVDRVLAYGEMGALYQAYGLFEAARASYLNAAQLAPDDFRWHYYLGLLERDRNQPEASIASLQRALTLAPGDVPTLVRLGEMQRDQGRADLAAPLLEKAAALDPDNAAALATLGQIALSDREFEQAAALLERALRLQPDASSLRSPLAMAYRGLGDRDQAAAEIARHGGGEVTMIDPLLRKLYGLARAQREHQQAGTAAFAAGRVEEAIAEFRQAVREDPIFSLPRVNLALALLRAGKPQEAADELTAARRIAPESPRVHFAFGYLRAQQGAQAEAAQHYRAAVAADPDHSEAWFNLGGALDALDRHGEAAAAYAEVVRRRADWPVARLREAQALVLAERYGDARTRLDAAAAALPADGYVAHARARVLAAAPEAAVRDGREALATARALFDARPGFEHAETVAMALAELGRFDEAIAWQEQAVGLAGQGGRDAEVKRLQRGLALYRRGEPARAPWQETGELVPFPGAAR